MDVVTVMKLRGQSHGAAAPWVGMRVVWQSLKLKVFPMNVLTVAALVLLIVNDSRVLAGGVFVDVTDEAEVGYLQWTPPKEWI